MDILLLHYTGMQSAAAARDWLCDQRSRVSAHYLIDQDGEITALVDEHRRAWHAGVSCWAGETDINSRSIGIEIDNPGHAAGAPDFPDRQIAALIELAQAILARHQIPPARVLAHSDVAPARKIDPGEAFPWPRLAAAGVGLWFDPPAPDEDMVLEVGGQGDAVTALQAGLARFGYGLAESGAYDPGTATVVSAFQRHFRPARVDGRADGSTRAALARLLNLAGID